MKFRHIIIMVLAAGLAIGAGIIASLWGTHWIFLSGGEIIQADKAWVVFDQVFYEKGAGTLLTVDTDAVDEILRADFSSFHDWKIILSNAAASGQGMFGVLKRWDVWVLFLAALGAYPFLKSVRFLASGKSSECKNEKAAEDLVSVPIPPQSSDTEKVILFFLNLFLLEIKAGKKDRYNYQPLNIKGPLNTSVYEFRVHIDGQEQTRRISLGRIGEDSGAHSKCFYVIFDDHFVVKIPPEPVRNIDEYILNIRSDQRIADKLSPRDCLVPRVSMILKRIPGFVKTIGKPAASSEQACLEGLIGFTKFQRFLKVGEGYGFFMDFSRHFFLGQILKECHNVGPETIKEIRQNGDLVWSSSDFTDRYGDEFTNLCFEIQEGFRRFDSLLNMAAISRSQKKNWFAGVFLDRQDPEALKNIPENVSILLEQIKKEYPGTAAAYQRMIRKYSEKILLNRNNAKIRNIISRLLELLSWLFFKQVAIRDLKPDNLMVAGDPAKYPQFLNAPDGFELGLIDVETSVCLDSGSDLPDQPKLGWTPFYATPAHMFTNEVLGRLYEDVRHVFFLQDWYASVVIIFQAITGKRLFVKTAGILAGFSKSLPQYFDDPAQMSEFARNATKKFWQAASDEFDAGMRENRGLLMAVPLEITRNAKKMFHAAAEKSMDHGLKIRLAEIESPITAYDGLTMIFHHVREIMNPMP